MVENPELQVDRGGDPSRRNGTRQSVQPVERAKELVCPQYAGTLEGAGGLRQTRRGSQQEEVRSEGPGKALCTGTTGLGVTVLLSCLLRKGWRVGQRQQERKGPPTGRRLTGGWRNAPRLMHPDGAPSAFPEGSDVR